ncbi:M48 family metalloprotease [Lacibacter sp. MH-610]|uniref:M48 family metallopeptidase n=1 Tax=Lacibacter sp. MH-610 TaxID=3020883 RepID=UPI00389286F2
MQNLYPPTPMNVPASVTDPSPAFKTEVKKVMSSILFFFIVYIILIVLAVALAAGCIMLGIGVMMALGSLLGLVAGLGIMSIGVMVIIFLVKFIFSVKRHDESQTIEIKEQEQPELFAFIRQLTIDTQTPFPKKIVLSPEVNASVYYNDSFWSMILPVKKNLQIGLGLVNSVTLSEFKAIMAHEFGHFSQKSMKLGSFVYNVNKAIYNMLFENNDFGKFLSGWGSLHWAISIFVWFTIQIIKGIQSILQSMYGFINKTYMSLSREMEFHADAVAASVSGSKPLITALKKIEVSGLCYQTVLEKADERLKQKEAFQNVYSNHNVVMKHYAEQFDLPLQNNAPVVSDEFLNRFRLSRLNIKDQWASHPSTEDREQKLNALGIPSADDGRSAWILFREPEQLQQQLTGVLYKAVPQEAKEKVTDEAIFKQSYIEEATTYSLPEVYKGYFDGRQMNDMDFEKVFSTSNTIPLKKESLSELFAEEIVNIPKKLAANESDAALLNAIAESRIDTKTFDYDGEKYEKKDAASVLEKVNKEIEMQKQQLQQQDEAVVIFFADAAKKCSEADWQLLKDKYSAHFANRKKADEHFIVAQRVLDIMGPLLRGEQVSIEAAGTMAAELRTESEHLKPLLKEWTNNGVFDSNEELKEKARQFMLTHYQYFSGDTFFDTELSQLHQLVGESYVGVGAFQFKNFKALLQWQLELLEKAA